MSVFTWNGDNGRFVVLMLLTYVAAICGTADIHGVTAVPHLNWGEGRDVVALFNAGEPVVIRNSPVREWPLLQLDSSSLRETLLDLSFGQVVYSTVKGERVIHAAKRLPDARDVLYETTTNAYKLTDLDGSEFEQRARNFLEGESGGLLWRSTNLLGDNDEAKTLWKFILQSVSGFEGDGDTKGSFDLRWLLYRLQHGPFDGRPSVSLEAIAHKTR